MDPTSAMQTYREVGVAGLFIAMYVVTVAMFIQDLRAQRKEAKECTEKMVKALDASTEAQSRNIEVMQKLKDTLTEHTRQLTEFVAFLKGRDDREL